MILHCSSSKACHPQVLKHERILEDVNRIDPEALNRIDPEALNNVHNNGDLFNSPRQSIRELEKPGTRGSVRKR